MFDLGSADTLAVLGFAFTLLGGVAGVLVQVGRVLQKLTNIEHRLHDHEARLRLIERMAGIPPRALPAEVTK